MRRSCSSVRMRLRSCHCQSAQFWSVASGKKTFRKARDLEFIRMTRGRAASDGQGGKQQRRKVRHRGRCEKVLNTTRRFVFLVSQADERLLWLVLRRSVHFMLLCFRDALRAWRRVRMRQRPSAQSSAWPCLSRHTVE